MRVGGVIARLAAGGFDLDDGTAIARVDLEGDMATLVASLQIGDAVAATGIVEPSSMALRSSSSGNDGVLVRVGSLGQALPIAGSDSAPTPSASAGGHGAITANSAGLGVVRRADERPRDGAHLGAVRARDDRPEAAPAAPPPGGAGRSAGHAPTEEWLIGGPHRDCSAGRYRARVVPPISRRRRLSTNRA